MSEELEELELRLKDSEVKRQIEIRALQVKLEELEARSQREIEVLRSQKEMELSLLKEQGRMELETKGIEFKEAVGECERAWNEVNKLKEEKLYLESVMNTSSDEIVSIQQRKIEELLDEIRKIKESSKTLEKTCSNQKAHISRLVQVIAENVDETRLDEINRSL